jgi:hypothetical protein
VYCACPLRRDERVCCRICHRLWRLTHSLLSTSSSHTFHVVTSMGLHTAAPGICLRCEWREWVCTVIALYGVKNVLSRTLCDSSRALLLPILVCSMCALCPPSPASLTCLYAHPPATSSPLAQPNKVCACVCMLRLFSTA